MNQRDRRGNRVGVGVQASAGGALSARRQRTDRWHRRLSRSDSPDSVWRRPQPEASAWR